MKEVEKYQHKCPDCGSSNYWFDRDKGEAGCSECGRVFDDEYTRLIIGMDRGPDWRAFTDEEKAKRSHVGPPQKYSVHDKGVSMTTFRPWGRDASGKSLEKKQELKRLYKHQKRSRIISSKENNLSQAMAELNRLKDKLYIPGSVLEEAAVIYRKVLEKGLVRGRTIAGVAAAALHAACRYTGTPRTLREIAEASLVGKKDVARCYRLLLRKLDIQMPLVDHLKYVSKIAEKTHASGSVQDAAIRILKDAKRKHIPSGKDPQGIVAAAFYIGSLEVNERITEKDLAEAAEVTEVTIRNRKKQLIKKLGLDISN